MNDLLIGVIGSGGRGALARKAHRPGEGSRVTACCDLREEIFQANRQWYGNDVFTTADYRELLGRDLDAVFVTSPDFCHEEHAVAALRAGKTTYVEKPLAITIEGCDRILRAAMESGARLYVGHNMRHFDVILKMKEWVDRGAIGEVKTAWCRHFVSYGGDAYFKDWHAERRLSTGLLLQKGSHDIDVLHWLCGGFSAEVTAMGGLTLYDRIRDRHATDERGDARFDAQHWPPMTQRGMNPTMDVEDVSLMLMRLDNGVLASYEQCHFTPDAWRNYTFIGTQGRIENFGDGLGSDARVRLWNRRRDTFHEAGDETFDLPRKSGGHGGGDSRIVGEFVRYAREGGAIKTSPVAARYSVAAGFMATQSLRSGGVPMNVPRLDADLEQYFAASAPT